MSFVDLVEQVIPEGDPNPTEDHDPSHESMHRLHNARGRVYFTADRVFAESAPGARDGGAMGDGIVDDTNAINAAIQLCHDEGGGEVVLTGRAGDTYLISHYFDPSLVGHAGCVWMLANVTLTGRGRGTSILRLADDQVDFVRPISMPPFQANVEIRNLQIDGNQANEPQGTNVNEHVSGIFSDCSIDLLVENVDIHDTRGDGVHLSTSTTSNSVRPVLRNVKVHSVVRVGINLSRCTQAEVSGCHVYGMLANNLMKVEVDNDLSSISNPYFAVDGCIISGCILDGSAGATTVGATISGSGAATRVRDIVIQGCDFVGCSAGVSIGVYGSDGFNVSDNNFARCKKAIFQTSYSGDNGYAQHVGVVICNNNIRESTGSAAGDYQITVNNATNVTISGNTIAGAALTGAILLQSCTEFSVHAGSITMGGAAGGSGIFLYRSYNGQVTGGKVTSKGAASRAVTVSLDSTYPLGLITIADVTHISNGAATSSVTISVDPADTTALNSHVIGLGLIHTDCSGIVVAGIDDGRSTFPFFGRHTFGTIKKTLGLAAPTTGTWTRGDTCENTNKIELGSTGAKYILWGWACVTTGTSGTWKEMRMLTGG